jgi:hypothetical protein
MHIIVSPCLSRAVEIIELVFKKLILQDAQMKILVEVARSFSSIFGRKNDQLSRSKLVGMYLTQANGRDGVASEFSQSRQRRNGKYSHNRERA